jgi:hypothetical protein
VPGSLVGGFVVDQGAGAMAPTEASQAVRARLAQRVARFARYQALRLRARWSHWSLDAKLAAGIDPASDPELMLRAAQLRSARHRRRLAAWVERLVRECDAARAPSFTAAVPIVREQVVQARGSLLFLAHLLRHAERVEPRGIAMVEQLLADGGSVLYTDSSRGAVELQVQTALDYLVGQRDATPEDWFSVV